MPFDRVQDRSVSARVHEMKRCKVCVVSVTLRLHILNVAELLRCLKSDHQYLIMFTHYSLVTNFCLLPLHFHHYLSSLFISPIHCLNKIPSCRIRDCLCRSTERPRIFYKGALRNSDHYFSTLTVSER